VAEMLENASAIRPSSEGRPARVRLGSDGRSFRIRSRASNDPKYIPKQPNLRAQDRRRRDLITAFLSALEPSGVNDLTQVMVRRAAELTVAAEVCARRHAHRQPAERHHRPDQAGERCAPGGARARSPGRGAAAKGARAGAGAATLAEDAERERKVKAKATEAGDGR